jgi:hypothetical protein
MTGKKKAKATGAWAGDFVEIRNRDATLRIEKATGLIRGCIWRKTGVDLFRQTRGGIPGYIGGLRIYDELDDRWYDDWRTPFTVTRASAPAGLAAIMRTAVFRADHLTAARA